MNLLWSKVVKAGGQRPVLARRQIFSPQTLSRSNVLVMNNYFEVALSVSMMGQSMELLRRPTETLEEYTYQYNDKKYPVKVMGDSEIIYAYKN